jgi:hypothetical protein
MNTSPIIRLRGDGPDLVWDAPALASRIEKCCLLWGSGTCEDCNDTCRSHHYRLTRARQDAARAFAGPQGWSRLASAVAVHQLVEKQRGSNEHRGAPTEPWLPRWASPEWYDHPESFGAHGRFAATIIHPYRGTIDLAQVPPGIVVDQLPTSWYAPQSTTAFVLRPGPTTRLH